MSLARRYATLGVLALFALQFLWHAFLSPPAAARWPIAAAFALPLLPSLIGLVLGRRSAVFWGAIAALLYFCHGIAEAWSDPQTRPLALVEAALSVWTIVAGSWDGLRARFSKRKTAAPNV